MERTIEALIKNSPLALIVIGLVLFVLGAAGGWKSQGLEIHETEWRIALAVMGAIVTTLGSLLLLRSRESKPLAPDAAPTQKYGIKISEPRNNSILGDQFELKGTYDKKPPTNGCAVFSIGPDNLYHFKRYIHFENSNDRSWSTMLNFSSQAGRRIIKVVEIDRAGLALAEYQRKLQRFGYWIGIETLTPDIVICDSITIEWKPDPSAAERKEKSVR